MKKEIRGVKITKVWTSDDYMEVFIEKVGTMFSIKFNFDCPDFVKKVLEQKVDELLEADYGPKHN